MSAAARRGPLLALAAVALFAGLWGGLLLLGLRLDAGGATLAEAHGVLMTLGFLGTLISLERAVALRRSWAYVAPIAAGTGALLVLSGAPGALGQALLLLAGAVLVAAHVTIDRSRRSLHNAIMGLGALAWCAAVIWWLGGADVARFVPLLAAFLVLTIVGERVELARLAGPGAPLPRLWLGGALTALVTGLAVSLPAPELGVRIAGVGLVGLALWLARYDIARRTVRSAGSPASWRSPCSPGTSGSPSAAPSGSPATPRVAPASPTTPPCTRSSSASCSRWCSRTRR